MNLHSRETSFFYTSYLGMDHHDNLMSLITTFIVHWFQHLQNITTGKNFSTGKLINAEAIGMNTIKAFMLITPGLGKIFIIRRYIDYSQTSLQYEKQVSDNLMSHILKHSTLP
jgi:hypothetical protein